MEIVHYCDDDFKSLYIFQIVHVKCTQLTVCQLYPSMAVFKNVNFCVSNYFKVFKMTFLK